MYMPSVKMLYIQFFLILFIATQYHALFHEFIYYANTEVNNTYCMVPDLQQTA